MKYYSNKTDQERAPRARETWADPAYLLRFLGRMQSPDARPRPRPGVTPGTRLKDDLRRRCPVRVAAQRASLLFHNLRHPPVLT